MRAADIDDASLTSLAVTARPSTVASVSLPSLPLLPLVRLPRPPKPPVPKPVTTIAISAIRRSPTVAQERSDLRKLEIMYGPEMEVRLRRP